MPDDEAEAVYAYVQWLYTGKIACKTPAEDNEAYCYLASLYVLGEKLLDRNFQDMVVNVITAFTRWIDPTTTFAYFPSPSAIAIAYHYTPPGSPIRRLLVDIFVRHGSPNWLDSRCFGQDFMHELARTMMDDRGAKNDKRFAELESGIPCSYHHHAKDDACGKMPNAGKRPILRADGDRKRRKFSA